MSSLPKTHDNGRVHRYLHSYLKAWELCEAHPAIDDIFSGVLALKSEGDSSTRSLSRQVLFHILQCCPSIHVGAISGATNGRYAYSTNAAYAAASRVASKAIANYLDQMNCKVQPLTILEERKRLDAPYLARLEATGSIEATAISNLKKGGREMSKDRLQSSQGIGSRAVTNMEP